MILKYPPILQVFVSVAIAWAIQSYLPQFSVPIPFGNWIAASFCVTGVAITSVAVGIFASNKTTINPVQPEQASNLVTGGLYRISRNPMYLGLVLIITGFVIWFENIAGIASIVLFILTMTLFQIKPEEKVMQAKFGEAYETYRRRVRRWI
ncbi:isoprenylcysteine carboxylmethyltransferase family protein [Parvularcula sp. IMCC14364]|uniref:methyltransferase family protein n=1 Tax=Parvularcula sp. IMCC14364 TaxID=3067902 RepID=UPI002740B180|nr:isoprenylcysteine carboxylmethyltransferase family protein [Parvularcula sp. IMCC14364]